MMTSLGVSRDERVLRVLIDEAVIDVDVVSMLASAIDTAEADGIDNLVVEFGNDRGSITGDFPSWSFDGGRNDIRFFARWDELLSRISRLKAKTFAVYDGKVGPAAVYLGFVTDLRVATADAQLVVGSLADGGFPGMAAYWLAKFVGLGTARKLFMLGADLPAAQAADVGLVDLVADTVDAVVADALDATRSVAPEAAYFTRRILDDCYLLEPPAAVEQIKAARFKLGMSAIRSAS
jgi:enoyl-CoA hydratase/carnithine racemase